MGKPIKGYEVSEPSSEHTVAVILAGGSGTRFRSTVPKQFSKVAGLSLLEHTLAVFESSEDIDEIILMSHPDYVSAMESAYAGRAGSKVVAVHAGGRTRNETSQLALELISNSRAKVMFHDAVRPFVDHRVIRDCAVALDAYDAVDTVIPSADTIVEVEGGLIHSIPDRSRLRRGQTPQGFRVDTLRRAYALAAVDPTFSATDDCGVVQRYLPGTAISVVAGTDENIKITEPIDLELADKIFHMRTRASGGSMSAQALTESLAGLSIVIFGGSSGIGAEMAKLAVAAGAEVHSFSRSTTDTDVNDPASLGRAIGSAYERSGKVDAVVNAAALLARSPLVEAHEADLRRLVDVNLLGAMNVARASHEVLKASHGSLLLFTSSSYTRGRAGYLAYSAAKAAVVNMTFALAEEWAGVGVRVNCLSPGRTATPMRTAAFGDEPPGSLLEAMSVAREALKVLCSQHTGQVVDVRNEAVVS